MARPVARSAPGPQTTAGAQRAPAEELFQAIQAHRPDTARRRRRGPAGGSTALLTAHTGENAIRRRASDACITPSRSTAGVSPPSLP